MLGFFISLTVVAVERFLTRKRLALHEILRDVGWLTILFAAIEFAYLFFVEAATLNYHSAAAPLWGTEWSVFRDVFAEAALGVMTVLLSVFVEHSVGEVKLTKERFFRAPARRRHTSVRCDVEWK
jgi:hypothetical protein